MMMPLLLLPPPSSTDINSATKIRGWSCCCLMLLVLTAPQVAAADQVHAQRLQHASSLQNYDWSEFLNTASAAEAQGLEGGPGQAGCPCVDVPEYYWREQWWTVPTPTRESAQPAERFNCTSPPPGEINFQLMKNNSGQFTPASGQCLMHPGYYGGDEQTPHNFPVFANHGSTCKKHHEQVPACYNITSGQELPPGVRENVRAPPRHPSLGTAAALEQETILTWNLCAGQWCDNAWCYVEPTNCNLPGATVSDLIWAETSSSCEDDTSSCPLMYSYGTCGAEDVWSSSDLANRVDPYVNTKRDFLTLGAGPMTHIPHVASSAYGLVSAPPPPFWRAQS